MKIRLFVATLLFIPFLCLGQEVEELPYIQHDDFVVNTFGFPATIKNFQKKYDAVLSISRKPVKNIHDSTVVDTVYTFSSGTTKIEIYKAQHDELLQSAYIDTDNIPLKYNIRVGNKKDVVARRLKTKITADKVQVGNLEQTLVYTLTFSEGRLASVLFEGYLD